MTHKLSIEVDGITVEEAIKKALKKLKLPRHRVKIQVLAEEEKGLFGMSGAKPAKIRVSIIKDFPEDGTVSGRKENT